MATAGGRRTGDPCTVPVAPEPGPPSALAERIIDAALRCVARWGIAKTTLDDVAREAACGRASIYRTFPGGKQALVRAAGEREVRRFLDDLAVRAETFTDLRQLIVVALVDGVTAVRNHEALQYLLEHEPGPVVAIVAFDGLDPLLTVGTEFGRRELERYLTPRAARETAEWVARLIVANGLAPGRNDFTDPVVVDRIVSTYLLPGLLDDLRATAA